MPLLTFGQKAKEGDGRVLRWGLLSTARINRALIPPLRVSPRNQLVAVASRDRLKAKAYAKKWRIPQAYGSYEELLGDAQIDVVYISLPNAMHAEWAIKACQAGKHVLCEKPLALTVAEVDQMEAAAREAGVVLTEAFMYRSHPQTLKAKELVSSGALGQLQLVRGAFSYTLTDTANVRMDPRLGGGSLWDVGCYPIGYTRYLAGSEPEGVFGWSTVGPTGVDTLFAGQMRFPNGLLAQFESSFSVPFRAFMEVAGTEGVLTIRSPYKPGRHEGLELWRNGRRKLVRVEAPELYLNEVEDMADAILNGARPRVSLADSRANIATITALLRSAETGSPIALKDQPT